MDRTTSLDELPLWLAKAALDGMPVEDIWEGFVQRINTLGFGVGRAYLAARLLNPLIRAEGYIYERSGNRVEREQYQHAVMPENYQRSPIHYMLSNEIYHLYRRLTGPEAQLDFDVLHDFVHRGYSAWTAYLIPFSLLGVEMTDEPLGFMVTFCCDLPDGWLPGHREQFERLLPHLSAALQGRIFAQLTQDLLTTYLGRDAASRVLRGTTTRGDMRRLRAAILYADFRGFTERSEILEPAALLTSLDRHFDRLVEPIEAQGGEVLKFMGDGLLAVFPVLEHGDSKACRAALTAARQALAANAELMAADPQAMSLDLALHLGDVLYGNVGGPRRLDFTVIGPAVNAAARMVQKGKELDQAFVISAAIARHLKTNELISVGGHTLRGIAGNQDLFTLR